MHATHSSALAWRIPWTEEPGGLQAIGSQRVGSDWSDWVCTHACWGIRQSEISYFFVCFHILIFLLIYPLLHRDIFLLQKKHDSQSPNLYLVPSVAPVSLNCDSLRDCWPFPHLLLPCLSSSVILNWDTILQRPAGISIKTFLCKLELHLSQTNAIFVKKCTETLTLIFFSLPSIHSVYNWQDLIPK